MIRAFDGSDFRLFRALDTHQDEKEIRVTKRLLMLGLLAALSALSTGCCGRIRQCIANRWQANHMYGGGACCTPAFKVPAQHGALGCSTCGPEAGAMVYQGQVHNPAGVPNIGYPMPLLGTGAVPSTMPPKN